MKIFDLMFANGSPINPCTSSGNQTFIKSYLRILNFEKKITRIEIRSHYLEFTITIASEKSN